MTPREVLRELDVEYMSKRLELPCRLHGLDLEFLSQQLK